MSILPALRLPRTATRDSSKAPKGSLANTSSGSRRTPSRKLLGVGVVAMVMLIQAVTQYLSGHDRARVLTHLAFVAIQMPFIVLALSATYAWALRSRFSSIRSLLACVLAAGAMGLVFGAALFWIGRFYPNVRLHPGPALTLPRTLLYGFTNAQMQAGLWTLAFIFPFAIEDARMRALEAEQLRSAAELARLRAHLEPHFLLNTLNAIAGLVAEEPREARKLLACLGDLLRDALHDADELQALDEQVAWLRRYAAILQARHGEAIQFEWNISQDAGGALLPRLLLQPLVENAVKHGALCRRGGGTVVVSARVVQGPEAKVVCVVEDNGPGTADAEVRAGAFGLHAVRRRLELRYSGATMRLESSPRGTRSIVELPLEALGNASAARQGVEARP